MDLILRGLAPLCLASLTGCAAVGVIATDDPWQQLENAQAMIEQNRPGPAERFIFEALAECQKRKDTDCEAAAYREYGIFFLWATGEWNNYYGRFGFKDKSANYENRYQMAAKYFVMAEELYRQTSKFDAVTNVTLNLGFAYQAMIDRQAACQAFDASLAANHENLRLNPEAEVILPKKYVSYENYIAIRKKQTGCPGSEDG
jgi:tetratricopeptide (TPR) repeat protein